MDRKNFLQNILLAAASVCISGQVKAMPDGSHSSDCETTKDILGPYYRANAPERNNLLEKDVQGTTIEIQGNVFGDDCISVIPNALVEIWHCNDNGEYDNDSNFFKHRAQWKSNKDGYYSFKTIVPGKYLNGELYRPSHIHFRVRAEGYKELVSQIYFDGDPHIETDPWASDPRAVQRILSIAPHTITGNLAVAFNIYLKK